MGAPLDVAVAYSRRSTFGSELGGGDPDATQLHPPATCQHALSRVQSGAEQCDPEDSQMQGEAPKLQFSLSGNLSDCSETLRADVVGAVGAMRRQNSCMSLDDDYITENAIMEDPRDETSGTAGLMEPSLPKHVQVGTPCKR